jgi:hypothetical protein
MAVRPAARPTGDAWREPRPGGGTFQVQETGHGPAEEFGPPDASIEEHDHAVGPRQGEDKAGHTATAAEVEDPGGRLDGD